jgi:flagellar motor protein MotB
VTGYTDSLRVSTPTVGNEWLALERARSVKRELVSLGYPENKILLEAKFLCCYLDTNETESGRYHNRRAEISLIQTTE